MKLKPLMPSLREKKRYIAFEVKTKDKITFSETKNAIEDKMKEFIGTLGMGNAGMIFLKDWKDNKGIVRVNSKYVDHTKASLALIKEVNKKKAKIQSLNVSGIIDKLRKRYF
jgi:ribonuclease P/MRP protein subunit POP5